jgi:predicted transcriptional regulator
MSGHRPWREIRGTWPPEREERVAQRAAALRTACRLAALREGRGLTQTEVAERMGTVQPHIARVEARDDVYLSTLASYIEALGGELRLQAVFPDEEPVEVTLSVASTEQKLEATSTSA